MLALILSAAVGLASLLFFFSAFFAPKLHRKDDFLWSGFGFFYAAVLWLCDQRFTGSILLGQTVAVILILGFAWQTLRLRAAIAKQGIDPVTDFSVLTWIGGSFKGKRKAPTASVTPGTSPAPKPKTDVPLAPPPTETVSEPGDKEDKNIPAVSTPVESTTDTIEANEPDVEDINVNNQPGTRATSIESTESPKQSPTDAPATVSSSGAPIQPKSSFFKRLFGKKQSPAPVPTDPPQPAEAIADPEVTATVDTPETSIDDSGIETEEIKSNDSITEAVTIDSMPETESNWPVEPETKAGEEQNIEEAVAVPTEEASSEEVSVSSIATETVAGEMEDEVAVLAVEVEDDETADISTDEIEIADVLDDFPQAIDVSIEEDEPSILEPETEISVEATPNAEEATETESLDDKVNTNPPESENKETTE